MVFTDFTVEEVNLMCVFDYTSTRTRLIRQLREALPERIDGELQDLAQSLIARLETMSDAAYDAAKVLFYPEYGDDEDYEETIAEGGDGAGGDGSGGTGV